MCRFHFLDASWRGAIALFPALAFGAPGAPPPTLPATVYSERCAWDRPGHDPFMGDVVAAVDRYRDIPADVRARLQARMAQRAYDDVVSIRRDSIVGEAAYAATISDMHFGPNRLCRQVTRARWTAAMQERGLVYCEGSHCILVPTVCRNVSRITRARSADKQALVPAGPTPDEFDPQALPPTSAGYPGAPPGVTEGVPDAGFAPMPTPAGSLAITAADTFWPAAPPAFAPAGFGAPPAITGPSFAAAPTIGVPHVLAALPLDLPGPPGFAGSGDGFTAPAASATLSAVPEPAAGISLLVGLGVLALARRRSCG